MIVINATVSKVSHLENENEWWSVRKIVFKVSQRSKEMYGQNNILRSELHWDFCTIYKDYCDMHRFFGNFSIKNCIFTHRKWWSCDFLIYIWKIHEYPSNPYILCKSLNVVWISYQLIFFHNIILAIHFLISLKYLKIVKKNFSWPPLWYQNQNLLILSHLSETFNIPAVCTLQIHPVGRSLVSVVCDEINKFYFIVLCCVNVKWMEILYFNTWGINQSVCPANYCTKLYLLVMWSELRGHIFIF